MRSSNLFRLAIVGLGYVGLPLAQLFIDKGHTVYGIDSDQAKIASLRQGLSYLSDLPSSDVQGMMQTGRFHIGDSFDVVAGVDTIIVCVPTPLHPNLQPDLSYVRSAAERALPYLRPGQLFVLESSSYPGTTEEEIRPLLEAQGFVMGRDIALAYSPERIDPGQRQYRLEEVPKLVGGVTPACTAYASRVYKSAFMNVVEVSSPRVAEMAKLVENSQRFINISFMNDLSRLCNKMNINVWEVIQAAGTKPYGFTPYYPGPGVGGHCIPVDPLYLMWKAKDCGVELPLIEASRRINDAMPEYIVQRIEDMLLLRRNQPLHESRLLIVGITYKKNSNDTRESSPVKIIQHLLRRGVQLDYHDPLVDEFRLDQIHLKSVPLTPSTIQAYDCTIILTDHSSLPYQLLVDAAPLVFDARNALGDWSPGGNVISL
ncbi:nucleotide sugar dehydrogenase [Paenibacillus aurantiacus]|uniref:Nucleotide sugar dehydrogenase n=1 Tax=Paenibacillus aurantiacus TaxID=1936118 RepID=A0ABV5KH32_9BACL